MRFLFGATLVTVVLGAVACGSGGLSAATIVLQASQDTTLFKGTTSAPTSDNNGGGSNGLFAGNNGMGFTRRAMVTFDVAAAVPAGAVIQSATLTMRLAQVAGSGMGGGEGFFDVELHRMTATWGEGAKQRRDPPDDSLMGQGAGLAADAGEATWNSRFHAEQLWVNPQGGGDFLAAASSSLSIGFTTGVDYSWASNAALVNDVQTWLNNPAANAGWLIKNVDEFNARTLRTFYSRDTATVPYRPRLSLTYTVPGSPADFNGDHVVDGADLTKWGMRYGVIAGSDADADGDGDTDGDDFLVWQREVGAAPAIAVAEPAAGGLIAGLGVWLCGRRRAWRAGRSQRVS